MLTVKNLTKTFGARTPVNGVSFEVRPGSCTALLGPNGAGKTTTLRMLAGLMAPSEGTISFDGGSPDGRRSRIGYLPQYPKFYNWMTAKEYIEFCAGLSGLKGRQTAKRTGEVLEITGLQNDAKRRISGFSGGMKQRLGLAQALVHEPEILFLDEPVSALDPIGRREVIDLIRGLQDTRTTILFSTHVLHDAEEICDELIFMNEGRIAEQGAMEELRKRYRQPVIDIAAEYSEESALWLGSLAGKPYVMESRIAASAARLHVTDIKEAREQLMKEIADQAIPIVKFEAGMSSLEDLFMRVVGRS